MADLDADLQDGNDSLYGSVDDIFYEDHISYDGDLMAPQQKVYDSEHSSCTCEGGTPTIHTVGITPSASELVVQFSANVVLSGPALDPNSWIVTLDGLGHQVVVTAVEFAGDTVTLAVSPQTLNGDYTLHLPTLGITSPAFGIFTGLYSLDFLGVATPVNIQMVKVIDTHTIDVIFAIAVDETTASDPLNYTLNNGLTVVSSTKITDFWYRLRNDPRQVDATTYTLTVSNVEPKHA